MDEDEDLIESPDSEEVENNRLAKGTSRQYSRLMKKIVSFFELNHPTLLENDEIILPLSVETVRGFFNYVKKKRGRNGILLEPAQFNSVSHIGLYRSCICDYYKKKRVAMDHELKTFFDNFMTGYKKQIAGLRQEGLMPAIEGKMPLTENCYQFIANRALRYHDHAIAPIAHGFTLLSWNM